VAGTVELAIRGAVRGQMIRISVSERLNDSGGLEIGAYGAPYYPQDSYPDGKAPYNLRNTNIYIAKGEGEEYYSPRFCYTGFRYVMVDGIAVDEADVHVREMHNDLPVVGNFESCDETVNRLWDAIKQTWLNNCYNGPTDCPTREKNFWTGDTMIFSHLACWYTDCEEFLSRWTDLGRKMTGPYGWEDEEYILPWTLYRFYGDKEILKPRYKSICDLVNRRRESAKGGYLPQNPYSCYNDWLNPTGENLSPSFFAHCWYIHMLDVVSQIAEAVGDDESKALWKSEFKSGKELFNKLYYDFTAGEYSEKIQSSAVLPLAWGLVPKGEEQRVADTLHGYLVKNDFKLTTGFQASRFILEVLTDHGYGEDAVKLLKQKEFPSWGYMIDSGATNITESWLAMNDPDKSISMCHFSLGAAFSWFFEYLGGIRINECSAGFERVVIEPHCFEMLGECRVTYMSKHGEIIVEWRFEDGRLVFNYTVPDGIEAVVRNPKVYKHSETLHGK
jgi:alpha-L-rhamnosidase